MMHHSAHSTSCLQGALGGSKQKRTDSDLITVEDIVKHHWQEFGRSAAQIVPEQGCPYTCFPEAGLSKSAHHPDMVLQQL